MDDYEKIVDNHDFTFIYTTNTKKKQEKSYTMHSNSNPFKKSLRNDLNQNGSRIIVQNFKCYLERILNDYETMFDIPPVIERASSLFEFSKKNIENEIDTKVEDFIHLFKSCNTDFNLCSEQCLGLEKSCSCISQELKRFFKHVNDKHPTEKDRTKIITYYLSEFNLAETSLLNITNILRLLEVVQLMKSSQSTTERVVSVIKKKIVKGRYENKERNVNIDRVDVEAFIYFN